MEKVYCKNCKFYILLRDYFGNKDCPECKLTREKEVTFEKVKIVYGLSPSVKNEKNDCPDYQHKWWKFWVKR